MAVNIKNPRVEQLVNEVAGMTGETKVEAVLHALEERKARLVLMAAHGDPKARAMRVLEREIWPAIPVAEVGRKLSGAELDAILGYGPEGV